MMLIKGVLSIKRASRKRVVEARIKVKHLGWISLETRREQAERLAPIAEEKKRGRVKMH